MNVPTLRFPEFSGEWTEKRLGDGVSLLSGQHLGPQEYTNTAKGIPYFTGPSDFTDKENELTKWALIEGKSAAKGDVLITVKGNGVGELTILQLPKVAMGRQLMAVRGEGFLSEIVAHVLSSRRAELQALASGNLIPGLSRPAILNIKVRQPSLPEQKKIAAFLGVVDAKIAALRARVAGLERYKRGLMQALFSQTLRFTKDDGNPFPDWEEKRLGDLTSLITKGTTPTSVGHAFQATGVNFIKAESIDANGNIQSDKVAKISGECHAQLLRSQLKSGDILFSIAGTLGRTAIAKSDIIPANTNQALAIIRLRDSEDRTFINLFLNSRVIKKRISQLLSVGAQPNLSLGQVGSLVVPHPHPDEQAKIADALSAMDAKIAAVAGQLDRMQDFKKGLLQQMFV